MFKEFDKIIGYEGIKEDLKLICDVVKNYEKYEKLGVKFPGGVLLEGEPGIGKTLMAMCFIEAAGLKSFMCRKNKSDGEFVDEIKRVFDAAKAEAPSIVFLDDMDKFANEDTDHKDAEEYVTVQSCIDEVKGGKVFVIATVNDIDKIPESLQRSGRFDKHIRVAQPKGEDARKIIEHFLSQMTNIGNVKLDEVAYLLEGNSCATLETVINKAGMYAGFYNKENIEMEDIVQAYLDVKFSATKEKEQNTKEVEYIGVHEAGHAVVAEILFPQSVNLIVLKRLNMSIGMRGLVSRASDRIDLEPFKKLEYNLMIELAGKAATEVILGTVDVGCNHDLHRAFNSATELVDDVCAFGFDTFARRDSGSELANKKDYQISKVLEKYYNKTIKILENNQEFLKAISKELLERRVLLRTDIDRIKEEIPVNRVW